MLLGSVQFQMLGASTVTSEVYTSTTGSCCFAPVGRVRFLGQLQLLIALPVTAQGAEMGESRKALEAMGHMLHSWGTMRDRKGQNLPKLWFHNVPYFPAQHKNDLSLLVFR